MNITNLLQNRYKFMTKRMELKLFFRHSVHIYNKRILG